MKLIAGQKVVCVKSEFDHNSFNTHLMPNQPTVGKTYTIRAAFDRSFGQAVHLEEIVNPGPKEGTFSAYKFLPLYESEELHHAQNE